MTWGTWPNCKAKPFSGQKFLQQKKRQTMLPLYKTKHSPLAACLAHKNWKTTGVQLKKHQKILLACANQSKDSKLHLSLPQMYSPNSAIWLNLIWVAIKRATKDGETTYMRKNWHPVPTPRLFRSCSILVKMTSLLCLGKFIFSISLFLHCTTPWSGVTMAQVLTVRVLLFMSIVKTRTICFVSGERQPGSTGRYPLYFTTVTRIHTIVAIRVSVQKPFNLLLNSHPHLLT